MNRTWVKSFILLIVCAILSVLFVSADAWMKLCYGLALFLFGMQCIEEGLHLAAGGMLKQLMMKSTSTPWRGLFFGMGSTFLLQSSTLVSLLTMAFLSSGLITLLGGIAVLLGTNLGATSGIWLLALAGQNISLSPIAIPMLIFGVLAGFFKGKFKAIGMVLIGISLIFLGIDFIKEGFQSMGNDISYTSVQSSGVRAVLVFCFIGLMLTIVLQSTHAVLILALAALAGGQLDIVQAFAIAIGSNVGSSITTAMVGVLGSDRGGQRLAIAHLLFNTVTATVSLILWWPLTQLVLQVGEWTGINDLLQLALFHTLFNVLGVLIFWKQQQKLANLLLKWLPEKAQPAPSYEKVQPRYLSDNALLVGETASHAVFREVQRLSQFSLETLARTVFAPDSILQETSTDSLGEPLFDAMDSAHELYKSRVKPLYSAILEFSGKMTHDDEQVRQLLSIAHEISAQNVEAVKFGIQLQKNFREIFTEKDVGDVEKSQYLQLREQMVCILQGFMRTVLTPYKDSAKRQGLSDALSQKIDNLEIFRRQVMDALQQNQLTGKQTASLFNDISTVRHIGEILLNMINDINQLPESIVALQEA